MARAVAIVENSVQTSMPAMRRSPWRSMAVCTIGMPWTMHGACVQAAGTSQRMESGRIWRTHASAQGYAGTEGTALKSTYGWNVSGTGNGTDDFGFSALPGGGRDGAMATSTMPGIGHWWSSSPSGGNAWFRILATTVSSHLPVQRHIRDTASPSGVLGMPIERSEGGLTL